MATTSTTTALKLLPELWTPGFLYEAKNEMVIGNKFSTPQGVRKIGQKLHIPKVKAISATAGDGTSGLSLTYTANTELEITVSPSDFYAGVEVEHAVALRMDPSPDSVYRKMLIAGCVEYVDQQCGVLAASLATNVKGSGSASIDLGLLLDAQQALVTQCKSEFKPGVTDWYVIIHPSQLKNAMSIFNLTADYVRGDGVKPLVSGWLVKALGAMLDESGNIYQASGITHNMGFIRPAFVLGYNQEPTVIPPQDYELVTRIIATGEYGCSEQFDEYAVDIQTA